MQQIESIDADIKIVEYLNNPTSVKELEEVLEFLQLKTLDIVRKKASLYVDEYKNSLFTNDQWLKILV